MRTWRKNNEPEEEKQHFPYCSTEFVKISENTIYLLCKILKLNSFLKMHS